MHSEDRQARDRRVGSLLTTASHRGQTYLSQPRPYLDDPEPRRPRMIASASATWPPPPGPACSRQRAPSAVHSDESSLRDGDGRARLGTSLRPPFGSTGQATLEELQGWPAGPGALSSAELAVFSVLGSAPLPPATALSAVRSLLPGCWQGPAGGHGPQIVRPVPPLSTCRSFMEITQIQSLDSFAIRPAISSRGGRMVPLTRSRLFEE